MNCQACQIEIEELEVGEPVSEAASAHMTACAPCRAFHDERQSLRRLVGSLGPVMAPPDFEFRLRARLAANANGGSRHFSLRSFLSSAPAVALAASFALLVAGVIIYKQMKSRTVTTQPTEIAKAGGPTTVNTSATHSPESTGQNSAKENEDAPVIKIDGGKKPPVALTARSQNPVHSQPKQVDRGVQQATSNDILVRPAPRITPSNGSSQIAGSNQLVQLSVRSPLQPVRVSLDEKGGAKRMVTLEPVVFGSQDFTGRNLSHAATPQDIW